ncbi:hypothetical protein [Hyphomicrobium sp.]|uniref:hypothetical protein n=1 Tax=Hyphomicrobium sp. TaxID=82 RepID=UPI0025BF43F1|nr:hypothetical protein [Hyphomicrobium sp.]MCC7253948.1 hypothetical protein [Hyphomicrobium sp.]
MRYSMGIAAICAIGCGGCTNFFPSFSDTNILAAPAHGHIIPLAEVENSVKCELGAFLSHHFAKAEKSGSKLKLKNDEEATIVLEVVVASKGGVDYTEVDLDKGDLLTAILIAGSDKIKAPKAELNGTGTVTATVTLKMKQSAVDKKFYDKCGESDLANKLNPFSLNKLGINAWLHGFFSETWKSEIKDGPVTYLSEIKLETKFVLVAGLTSSFKRLITLVPITNFPLGTLNQNVTNKLTITFKGEEIKKKEEPKAPSVSDCLVAESGSSELPKKCEDVLKKWRKDWAGDKSAQDAVSSRFSRDMSESTAQAGL